MLCRIFGNFPQNLPEIFTAVCNSYEFHSEHFYILSKNFINNYFIYTRAVRLVLSLQMKNENFGDVAIYFST